MRDFAIWVADVGSVEQGRFGYCGIDQGGAIKGTGTDMREFVGHIVKDLSDGRPVALGFECPLYVPIRAEQNSLTRGRLVDGNRSWSAGPGCGVLATGLVEYLWVFREIHGSKVRAKPTLSWEQLGSGDANLFVWEAFVSGEAKDRSLKDDPGVHIRDAKIAGEAFVQWLKSGWLQNKDEGEVFSLVGAALLHSGLATDPNLLHQQCVVVKAQLTSKPE